MFSFLWWFGLYLWKNKNSKIQHFNNVIAAAAAKSLQLCPTVCNPIDSSPQAPPSLGFSRQEHWSGLPLPSPMHESEKWKWSHSVMSDSLWPHGLQPSRLLRPWDFPGKSTGVGCHCLLRSSSWDHCNANVGALMLSQRSLRLSSFFFFFSFFFCILFCGSDFCHSVLQVIYPFFCLHYSAIDSF